MNLLFPIDTTDAVHRRKTLLGQEPHLLWFTGLSGAGKSTIATRLEEALAHRGYKTFLLDGDNLRRGLNKDLGFSADDRRENIRRTGEAARLLLDAGLVVLAALISPFQEERDLVRQTVGGHRFSEVYIHCPLDVCESRDVKGLYQKARSGELPLFTGISSPYEPPASPALEIRTDQLSIDEAVQTLLRYTEPKLKLNA